MKAILLAAGRGSRMKEKTADLPKCLTELWGKPLLEWQLKAIREAGINEICIITGYCAEKIRNRYPDFSYFHNAAWETTNMVMTLCEAQEWLGKEECIVSYTDIFYEKKAIEALMRAKENISLVYYTKFLPLWQARFENPLEDLETFRIDGNSLLTEIGRKASSLDEIEGQYMGLLRFTPVGWKKMGHILNEKLPKPVEKMDMTGLLAYAIGRGMKIEALPYEDMWLEVDRKEDLKVYEEWMRHKDF